MIAIIIIIFSIIIIHSEFCTVSTQKCKKEFYKNNCKVLFLYEKVRAWLQWKRWLTTWSNGFGRISAWVNFKNFIYQDFSTLIWASARPRPNGSIRRATEWKKLSQANVESRNFEPGKVDRVRIVRQESGADKCWSNFDGETHDAAKWGRKRIGWWMVLMLIPFCHNTVSTIDCMSHPIWLTHCDTSWHI